MKSIFSVFAMLFAIQLSAQIPQPHKHAPQRTIRFPDVPGYYTLSCDFHQHTVFSDGSVWPDIRVEEAVRDSLDAISLTDHLEYQPHKDDIPHPNRNRTFEIAEKHAKPYDLIVVNGSEITRRLPPGHANAIFIQDANKLLIADSFEVFREARRQDAFVFWNHPNWISQQKSGVAALTDMHKKLIKENLMQGIEVVNDLTYSDEALQIALDNNLTIMGTSDIHGLIDWQFKTEEGGHRPVTLVFARERTAESIKEALFERRTAVWYNNSLIGREGQLIPLIASSLKVRSVEYIGASSVAKVVIENLSGAAFVLYNSGDFNFHEHTNLVQLFPQSTIDLYVKTHGQMKEFELEFEVLNAFMAPKRHPEILIKVKVEQP